MKDGVVITSTQNPKVKSLLALEKPRERRKQQLFIIEGKKEISLALAAGYHIGNLFYCADLVPEKDLAALNISDKFLVPITQEVFGKIAIREGSGGVIAVAEMKANRIGDIRLTKNPLILVLESVEKPGNLGAILRTADAAGVDAVIVCDPQTDFYNPNVVRSSLGCVFTVPVASATSTETIAWLKENKVNILCTYLKASHPYHEMDFRSPTAIVMGTCPRGWPRSLQSTVRLLQPLPGSPSHV